MQSNARYRMLGDELRVHALEPSHLLSLLRHSYSVLSLFLSLLDALYCALRIVSSPIDVFRDRDLV
jgi:hypothetical protein